MKPQYNTKKIALSTLFVAMLTVPTILGAIPLKVVTPVGVVSTEIQEAEARNRNTNANRPRSLSVRNSGAQLVQSFSANRRNYTVNVRQASGRADIRIGIREGQQHRWRIDTRNAQGNWRNGSYNPWRNRANRNINRDVRVNVSQGQERRLRVQIRDRSGNVRTVTVNVRRASGNTWGADLRANAGVFNRHFTRATTNYTLIIQDNRTATTRIGMRAEQERGQARSRVRIQNANGTWGAWSSWSSYTRGQSNRNVGTIPRGRQAQVQFMIRGAFSNMSNSPTRTRTYTVNVMRGIAPTSSIQLPNRRLTDAERANWIAEYNRMGGASAFELEVVRLVNRERTRRGLNALRVDTTLMHSARFYAQTLVNLNLPLGHFEGPYGGSRATADAFGARMRWLGGNAAGGHWTPDGLVSGWMNSPGHRRYILAPEHNYIGAGSQVGGQWGVFHYLLMSSLPSNP